jgi:hypothetical protein
MPNSPSPPILVTMMMEALRSSEMSVLTRVKRHNNPEDSILHSHRCENHKSYIILRHVSELGKIHHSGRIEKRLDMTMIKAQTIMASKV